ncbi:MAG: Transcriptional regulatory protein RcsB [Luteibacter sp.]|uniref:response regulator n=1 Tax=Luteibacter sp. TaxID=1886636 RepID=UPI0013849201|nr:response regulator [Luteibacter sp.]KAF1004755.1 MAG: Transcriptional regulatory protein RcsB [Luteibacter sp.]
MGYRVIVADDHPVVLKGVALALARNELAEVVGEALTPEALLDLLATVPCDALITDFSMPGEQEDGFALLAEIGRRHPDLPVMVITTRANPALYREILATGVRALIGKAGDTRDIPEALFRVMARPTYTYVGSSVRALLEQRYELPQGSPGTLAALSPREVEILRLFAAGNSVTDIARATGRGLSTISQQKSSAMRKLRLDSDAEILEYIDHLRF